MDIETKAVHIGHEIEKGTGAVSPPIYLTTTFERDADGSYPREYIYNRLQNPNRKSLEQALLVLEEGKAALAFSSGLAAIMAVFQSLSAGDHVLAADDLYHGTVKMLQEVFAPWQLQITFVDMSDFAAIREALQKNTKIIFTETPSNPLLKITDIEAVAELAHQVGARLVCDNTWATPLLQKPLLQGADIVVHSTTKYIGGHSDVLGGAVIGKEEDAFWQRLKLVQQIGGAVPSPFDCWLLLRGIQTLPCRLEKQCQTAAKIAVFLEQHPKIERVFYPGLKTHPGHEIALKQMKTFGAMLSFQVKGKEKEALALTGGVKIITRATSLGGVESLIEHRASIEGPGSKTPVNLLRFSVGLESADDLIADLSQALEAIN